MKKKIFLISLVMLVVATYSFAFSFFKLFESSPKTVEPQPVMVDYAHSQKKAPVSEKERHGAYVIVSAGTTDDGKGKICDFLAKDAYFSVRCQGSLPEGHKVQKDDKTYLLHYIPVAILTPHVKCYLAAGMVIDPEVLFKEIEGLQKQGIDLEDRLKVSTAAHLLMPYHVELDRLGRQTDTLHSASSIRHGALHASADKRLGMGIRIADLWGEDFPQILKEKLKIANETITKIYKGKPLAYAPMLKKFEEYKKKFEPYVRDRVELKLNQMLRKRKMGIFEGAHGTFLDITHGLYPYTAPTEAIASGVAAAAGVGPSKIDHTLGVVKAYATYEGEGPFTTEIKDPAILKHFREKNKHASSEEKYRYGWLDAVMVRQAMFINGMDSIAISRLDDLDGLDKIRVCIDYDYKENPNDTETQHFDYPPPRIKQLRKVTPHYVEFEGWKESTKDAKHLTQLPLNARVFVKRLEALFATPISIVSVGPRQDQTIVVNDFFRYI